MRRMYQTEWQGIQFADFSVPSSTALPTPEFFDAFYRTFFERYACWTEISPAWRQLKDLCADQVLSLASPDARVLAIGCGLGYIEHRILVKRPGLRLAIHEVAPVAWRWIGAELPDERKFTGFIPACLPADARFELIYLSAVDYAFDDASLIELLDAVRSFLSRDGDGGRCLILSASVDDHREGAGGLFRGAARAALDSARAVADRAGIRSRGQFWGWSRTPREYRRILQRAGYDQLDEGFLDPANRSQFWICGQPT